MLNAECYKNQKFDSHADESPLVIEVARLALRLLEESGRVNDDLALGVEVDVGAIHRSRRGALEVDTLAVVAAAVARALELVLARLPVGRAAEVRAAREDDEQALGVLHNPDAPLLLPLRVHADGVVAGEADAEDARRLEEGARQEEAQEHQEVYGEEREDAAPDYASAELVDGRVGRALDERPGGRLRRDRLRDAFVERLRRSGSRLRRAGRGHGARRRRSRRRHLLARRIARRRRVRHCPRRRATRGGRDGSPLARATLLRGLRLWPDDIASRGCEQVVHRRLLAVALLSDSGFAPFARCAGCTLGGRSRILVLIHAASSLQGSAST